MGRDLARHSDCDSLELWAISERVPFYEKFKFQKNGKVLSLEGETYHLMRRKLLYNVEPEEAA